VRRAGAAAVASLLAFSALAPSPALASAAEEGELLSLVNGLRSGRGLQPVAVHAELGALADEWAQRMATANDIFHSPLDTRVRARWVRLGENVAVDLSIVAAERALEASPGHLANLLSPSYDYVGIGVAHGNDGGIYVVQEFMQAAASRAGQSPRPKPPAAVAQMPIPAPARLPARPRPPASPPRLPRPPTPRPPDVPPPPVAPPEPRRPSVQLADVFLRLRGLDAGVSRPPRH
jgi:hypothetical protein